MKAAKRSARTKTAAKAKSASKPAAKKSTAAAKKSTTAAKKSTTAKKKPTTAKKEPTTAKKKPVLLSGGNPQIAKGDGDAPVQAYIAAMPGWKRALGKRLDALIEKSVPQLRKAVKWNSPFYGVGGASDDDKGWFLALHVFAKYVKVTFFRGTSLDPIPPGASKTKETRYLDLYEGELDEGQFVRWVKQAAALRGEKI